MVNKIDFDNTIKELSDKNIISPRVYTEKNATKRYQEKIPIFKNIDDRDLIKKSLQREDIINDLMKRNQKRIED